MKTKYDIFKLREADRIKVEVPEYSNGSGVWILLENENYLGFGASEYKVKATKYLSVEEMISLRNTLTRILQTEEFYKNIPQPTVQLYT